METMERISLANARRAMIAERIRMAVGKSGLDDQQFEAASKTAGRKIGRNRIAQLQKGLARRVLDDELFTIAIVCDVELAFVQGETVTLNGYDVGLDIPGYLNPDTSNRSRIDHALGDCIGCAIDRNFHVIDEWNYHDPITGQIELVLDLTRGYAEAV
jgi:hypothetical protein